MPYVNSHARFMLDDVDLVQPDNAGELNYVFTMIALSYAERAGGNYQAYNDVIGALEGCKLELYRRKLAPYEDTKIQENGDVY